MKYFFFVLLSLPLWLGVNLAKAAEDSSESKAIEVGISMSIPPWVIQETDSGIELDILRESLPNYRIVPVYVPFERAYKLFEDGHLDVVMNSKKNVAGSGYLSEPVATFQNFAISLASKNYPLNIPMSFLNDKSVIAFQKASQLLGPEFAEMAKINKRYQEVVKQELQINLLFIREEDFIVMDKSIFGYYWHQAMQGKSASRLAQKRFKQEVRFHPLFSKSPYPFLFKDQSLRDEFNAGLAELKKNGGYQAVIDKYDHLRDLYKATDSR